MEYFKEAKASQQNQKYSQLQEMQSRMMSQQLQQ